MNEKQFKIVRGLIALFIAISVFIAVTINNVILALSGVIIGVLFLVLVRKKTKAVLYDERVKSISGEAARLTYTIVTMVLAFLSLMFLSSGLRTDQLFAQALGTMFSYIALLNIAVYAILFKYYSKKYGTDNK